MRQEQLSTVTVHRQSLVVPIVGQSAQAGQWPDIEWIEIDFLWPVLHCLSDRGEPGIDGLPFTAKNQVDIHTRETRCADQRQGRLHLTAPLGTPHRLRVALVEGLHAQAKPVYAISTQQCQL